MAFAKDVPAEENPIGTDPITLYIRDALQEIDNHTGYASVGMRAWRDQEAYEAGKSQIGQTPGVSFAPYPTPDVFDQRTGELRQAARPSWSEIRAVFAAEFDYIDALWHELAKRYDPYLADATEVEPLPDPATLADIRARLDAAGLTGLSDT